MPHPGNITALLSRTLVRLLVLVVRGYQLGISPLLGSNCRFYPSCSHYCQEALQEHGVTQGLWLSCKRVLRCHPGHPGGIDPVPQKSLNHG